ncbi:MAG: transporter [Gemmatimonadaceae bacterium]|nr:transporter [Gemmatimonadaceae bacterium]
MRARRSTLMVIAALAAASLSAQAPAEAPWVANRPGFAEPPQLVARGAWQVETAVGFSYGRFGVAPASTSPTMLRYGVANGTEFRVASDGYCRSPGETGTVSGACDLSIGMGRALAKAHGWVPELSTFGYVKAPTGARAMRAMHLQPTAELSEEWALPFGVALDAMQGVTFADYAGTSTWSGFATLALWRSVAPRVRGFAELAAEEMTLQSAARRSLTAHTGFAFQLRPHWQVDLDLTRGLSKGAPAARVAAGMVVRP